MMAIFKNVLGKIKAYSEIQSNILLRTVPRRFEGTRDTLKGTEKYYEVEDRAWQS